LSGSIYSTSFAFTNKYFIMRYRMGKKILIVGGVAGGATAAARLRRLDETAEIIMFERGEHISFANCGLPYYVGGVIKERKNLLVQTPEAFHSRYNIDVRVLSEVVEIHRLEKKVTIKNISTGELYEESYDNLLLSPGASPIRPAFLGIDECTNLFTIRNISDIDAVKSYIEATKPAHATVIGGGFIGLEMAENLHKIGLEVTIIERGNQVMTLLDSEMAALVHEHLIEKGVNLSFGSGVKQIKEKGTVIELENGTKINTDLIILAVGIQPESSLAKHAGLAIGERGGIVVNEQMQTSDPSIYAVGDAIEVCDLVSGTQTIIALGGPANRQGRIAADNILGSQTVYKGSAGTYVFKVFDLTVAGSGNSERFLQKLNTPYRQVHIHPGSHAGYYPDATAISLKLLFSPDDGRILGVQGVGLNGVDKRIDVIATAMQSGLKAVQLQELQLAYAPPYSSAKDPVNLLGYVVEDITTGGIDTIQWNEINDLDPAKNLIIDVREPFELDLGSIKNSVNIPLSELRTRYTELPNDKTIILYCQVGLRGYIGARLLKQYGLTVKNLDGGFKTYSAVKDSARSVTVQVSDTGVSELKQNTVNSDAEMPEPAVSLTVDACGLQCPGPLMKIHEAIDALKPGEVVKVSATDPAFLVDAAHWCETTGNHLEKSEVQDGVYVAFIKKSDQSVAKPEHVNEVGNEPVTLIVFDGDLDKAIASFIIANGAAAFGRKVTMFFTFWGLNVLRKQHPPHVAKNVMDRMFGAMMPKGSHELGLSKMNMMGLGAKMINFTMKKKHVDTLEELMQKAIKQGVELIACSMSMDIMGIKSEELIEGVTIGGVATYLGEASKSKVNLFI
jgi:NADPH-dependent 2,4-dienoyl-CoA reductase/sulfur reductase-like enzyme/peroxiredoxin family protein/rhodanese-related sulfurtransferase/TusA-related sulfurtransferase